MESKVIVIEGPTCSGKTCLGILLAGKLNSEIISADSRQVYKYLDIGTAKPGADQLSRIRHHFISILEPDENYNVNRFSNEAHSTIHESLNNGKIPVVVGGSGLYIKALIKGIFDEVDADYEYREELLNKRKLYGNKFLYNELMNVDPDSASKMLPQNWKRVIRALEVFHSTGTTIGMHHKAHSDKTIDESREPNINFIQCGLRWDRESLYKNIEKRVDEMIADGLVEETKSLISRYDINLNSFNTVGYKEIISYLKEEISFDRAVELIKRNTRRFAKRQLTWFRANPEITWYDVKSQDELERIADEIILNENL